MDIFGIGVLEIMLIVLIALIVLGPQDMVKAGRSIGRLLRKTIFSPTWLNVQRTVRNLPYHLMREAGIEEEELKREFEQVKSGINQEIGTIHNDLNQDIRSVGTELSQANLDGATSEYVQEVKKASQVPTEWVSPPNGQEMDPSPVNNPSSLPAGESASELRNDN